ncbi:MAG: hypothetical protein K6C32_03995 [Bacilli bacterium]|nr:hypothetical protein [Bacilli bacterium]
MIIKLSQKDREKSFQLLDAKEINISIADLLMQAYEEKNYFHAGDYYSQLLKYWGAKDDKDILDIWVKNSIKELDDNYLLNNDYFKNVKPESFKENDYSLGYETYKPYQLLPLDDIKIDNDFYKEVTPVAYFKSEQKYLSLSYKDEIWMCITPNEIESMQPYVNLAKGKVLVLGLGLGYYPYMISFKEEVNDIYIVELDKKIIDIFNKHLLPFFKYKEKIHIIQGDALEYMKDLKDKFDTVFIDLWHNPFDGLPLYIELKKMENKGETHYLYWLEESLIALYRRLVLTVYEESLEGYSDLDYKDESNEINKIINDIYFKTKNITIKTYDDIHDLLNKDNLLKLLIS